MSDKTLLLTTAGIWFVGTIAILFYVVLEIRRARGERRRVEEGNIDGTFELLAGYYLKAGWHDFLQGACFIVVALISVTSALLYPHPPEAVDLLIRNGTRLVLLLSLLPMFLRVRDRQNLRRHYRRKAE